MGTRDEAGYSADDAGTWTQSVRETLDAELVDAGYPAGDYEGTIEGAWTTAAGVLASQLDEGLSIAYGSLDPDTAMGDPLIAYAAQAGVFRRPATASAYIVRATVASGSYVLPAGTVLQGGGDDGLATWTVDAATTVTTSATLVDIRCQQTGPIALPSTVTFRTVTPLPTTVTVTYDSSDGDAFTVGRTQESYAALRVRRKRSPSAVASPGSDGIRAGILALPWVVAASVVRVAAGVTRCTVFPGPAIASQQQALVDAIGRRIAVGTITDATGAAGSGTYTLSDGRTSTIYWHVGGEQVVAVVATLSLDPGWTLADVADVVTDSIEAAFAAVDIGGTIRYAAVGTAITGIQGVDGLTLLTLDGAAVNVTAASSTDFLTASITLS